MPVIDSPLVRSVRLPLWALVLLFLAYALPGNLGHVPWRGDDVLHIGMAHEMLQSGHWLFPRIAGFPYHEWPPLSHWLGASTGLLFGWLMPLADAIRLGVVVSLGLTVWLLRAAAARLYGAEAGTAAFLLSLGSLGLLVHAHEAQPQLGLLASLAGAFHGLALTRASPLRGSIIAGFSGAGAFLSAGLPGVLMTLPLWFVLPAGCRECRHGQVARGFLLALCIGVTVSLTWVLAFALLEPGVFQAWASQEVASVLPHKGHLARAGELVQMIAWFSWPLWPVVLWSLWRHRAELLRYEFLLPVAALLLALWLVITTGAFRPANALPLLPPLILLAAAGIAQLRRGAANFFDWFGVMTFSLLGIFLWVAWIALHFGWPQPLARNILRLTPGFAPDWSFGTVLVAMGLSVGWIIAIVRMPFFPLRGALHWALGVTLTWGLATSLWLDWFDYDKNYQSIARDIASAVRQQGSGCVASLDVGEVQRAALFYFEGLRIDPRPAARKRCELMLAYSTRRGARLQAPPPWEPVWQQARVRGRQQERFALFRR